MKSTIIPKDIQIYVFKSKWFKTIILEYKENKIWFNIDKNWELKINKEDRVALGKGLIIRLIKRGIETIKLGHRKEYTIEDGRPVLKEKEILMGTRKYKIPKDMSVTVTGNKIECWGKNVTDMDIFIESIKKWS